MFVSVFSYLVPSNTRRELLRVIWLAKENGSVSDLARLAKVAFSTAQRELKEMAGVGLVKSEGVGNAVVYRANEKCPAGKVVQKLLATKGLEQKGVLHYDRREAKKVLAHMKAMGAPLGTRGLPHRRSDRSDEEMLAEALGLARETATLARVLPVAIFKNIDKLDHEKLKLAANRRGVKQLLGFFLDLTGDLSNRRDLQEMAESLRDKRVRKTRDFFPADDNGYSAKLAELNTPPVAQKWHYRMNMGMDAFESLFRKHVAGNATV